MKKLFALLFALCLGLSLVSCSVPTPDDGTDGQDGDSGEDGQDGQDGKDGKDGLDGKDAVMSFKICKLTWPGTADSGSYDISYSVMELGSGAKHVDLNVVYKTEAALSFAENASATLTSGTSVETSGWKAEMADETNAIITRKALGQLKTVACQ